MNEYLLKKINEWGLQGIDTILFETALKHPSYDTVGKINNQRLEFLGDAVLDLILADYLYEQYPKRHEGELTRLRALLAQEATLAKVAKEIGLGQILYLGKGEDLDGGRERPSTLADAMEALIAAVYLTFGLQKATDFVLRYFGGLEGNLEECDKDVADFKSTLQEYVQSYSMENVVYKILKEDGEPHLRTFTAGVYYKKHLIGEGVGKTKKEAEKHAAKIGYTTLKSKGLPPWHDKK